MNTELRDELNDALYAIMRLENGMPFICCAITDPDQRNELLLAKASILLALDLEGKTK